MALKKCTIDGEVEIVSSIHQDCSAFKFSFLSFCSPVWLASISTTKVYFIAILVYISIVRHFVGNSTDQ